MKTEESTYKIPRNQLSFPSWSLWIIVIGIIIYNPIALILGSYVGHGVGIIARYLNTYLTIRLDLYYVIFIAAILGSILPVVLFLLVAQLLLSKSGYSWKNVWLSYDLNFINFIKSFLVGISLSLFAFGVISTFSSKPNIIVDLGIGYWSNIIFSIINYVLVAVIFEEIFYRGIFYQALKKRFSISISVLISAFFFTVSHVYYNSNIINLLIIFIFGISAAVIFERTQSLNGSLVLHFTYNATLSYMWL